MSNITELIVLTLLISIFTVVLYFLDKKYFNPSRKKNRKLQVIYGIIFGLIAIAGTEFGIMVNGAVMNVRDAAPVCAALFFSPQAGIIAGLMGGIERYFAVYWGAGEFTQIACTVGTIFSGIFAAFVKKYVFDNEIPSVAGALIVGGVAEVFHMLMLFVLRADDISLAFEVLQKCAPVMIPLVAISSTLAAYGITGFISIKFLSPGKRKRRIAQNIAVGLLASVTLAFVVTVSFDVFLQNKIADNTAENNITVALADAKDEIETAGFEGSKNQMAAINEELSNRHIGKNGYIIAVDGDAEAIEKKYTYFTVNLTKSIVEAIRVENQLKMVTVDYGIGSQTVYFCYDKLGDIYLVGIYPESETAFNKSLSASLLAMLEIVILAVVFLMVFFLVKVIVLKELNAINDDLALITQGKLDTHVDVKSSEEFVHLSDSINTTVDTLKDYIAKAEAKMDEEIRLAKIIQTSSLPNVFPDDSRFELYASMDAAREVGGDFYDFYPVGEDKYAFLIADVSGKGIPAAMFMMRAKSVIKGLVETGASPADAFTKSNEILCVDNSAEMFLTAWLGILELNTGHLTYANAGHNPPVLVKTDGTKEFIKSKPGFVMAGLDGFKYENFNLEIEEGSSIYLYTDGVTEATNVSDELFGEEKLIDTLSEAGTSNVRYLCKYVKAKVDEFAGEAPQFDDISMLAVMRKTDEARANSLTAEAKTESLSEFSAFIEKFAESHNIDMALANKMMIINDEMYSNIINYSKATKTVIRLEDIEDKVIMSFLDNGIYYNPLLKDDPDISLDAGDREIGGLGIFIVKNMAKDIKYTRTAGNNIVDIVLEK